MNVNKNTLAYTEDRCRLCPSVVDDVEKDLCHCPQKMLK
jgi:hypothetical protein